MTRVPMPKNISPNSPLRTILAIDLGTGGPKVSAVAASGEVVASSFAATPLIHTTDGGIEQDPEDWWRAIVSATRDALAELPPGAERPHAVAVTAQWTATVAIDAQVRPLANAISWMDGRGSGPAKRAVGPGPRVEGYNAFKLARWIRRTGGAPSLQGHDPVGQIGMLRERFPRVFEQAAWFVEPGDFLTALMTGNVATAPETATMSWGTDTRKIDDVKYDGALLKMGGLPPEKLAPIVPTGSVVGELLPERAQELGLEQVPVIASTPDVMSAAVGSGAVADGAMHVYLGTSSWLSGHVPYKRTDVFHNIASLPSSIPGRYLVCTEQQTAGRSLEHLRDSLLAGAADYEQLITEAERSGPGAGGVIFTPWLNGERTPIDDSSVRASYTNLSLKTTRGDLVRATLEGVAMNVRWMHHYTEKMVKTRIDDIALIGGGAVSALWCQVLADVLDRQVRRVEQPRQANTRGAALLAAAGLGETTIEEIADLVTSDKTFTPNQSNRGLHDERFDEFKNFYKANRKMFKRINDSEEEQG